MKEIFINGRFLSQPRSGTQRFAEEITTHLDQSLSEAPDPDLRITLLVPKNIKRHLELKNIQVQQVGTLKGHLWEQINLYAAARKGVLINFINSGPLLHGAAVTTFHDASVFEMPELFSFKYRLFHKLLRPMLAMRALKLITVSKFSRRQLAKAFFVSEDKFEVVPNGCDHIERHAPDDTVLADNGLTAGKYILCVGNATPNKNISAAARAYERAALDGFDFVSVGMPDGRVFGNVADDKVEMKRLRNISDNGLRALFENAAIFAFPSKYEGFGIPPLEAMRLGCPAITSRAAALPETMGDAAVLVDPDDIDAFAAEMTRLVADQSHRKEMVDRGYARSKHFEWQSSALKVRSLLETFSKETS